MGERETLPKRPREEGEREEATGEAKRHHHHHHHHHQQHRSSSYNHILSSLLEEEAGGEGEEWEISSLMIALQQELCSSDASSPPPVSAALHGSEQAETGLHLVEDEEGCCDAEGVMRRLFEASDDDLGIPPTGDAEGEEPAAAPWEAGDYGAQEGEEKLGGGGGGLWVENLEMEAMAAAAAASYYNYDYYALLQQELFL